MPSAHGSENEGVLRPQARPGPRRSLRTRTVLSNQETLLLALLRRDAPAKVSAERLALLGDPGFRSAFLAVAAGHGVIGLTLTALRRCGAFQSLDPKTRDSLFAPLRPFAFQAAMWDAERDRLLDALRAESLVPLVLKGAALRLTVYREAVERLSGDLDLLVSAHQVRNGLEALARAGYVDHWTDEARRAHLRRGYHLSLSHASGFEVELHWDLSARGEGFRFDPAAFLNRSVLHERAGADPVRVPCPEHMVLHLADQNREDSFSRLKRLVDIDRVIASAVASGSDLDWGYLVRQAREGGHETVVALALQLSRRLLDTPVPRSVLGDLSLKRSVRFHLSALRPDAYLLTQQGLRSTVAQRTLHLWLIRNWGDRYRWVRRVLRGSTNPMADVYSARRGIVISQTWNARLLRLRKILKLAVYHVILYLAAVRDRGRTQTGFWPAAASRSGLARRLRRFSKGLVWTSPANTTS